MLRSSFRLLVINDLSCELALSDRRQSGQNLSVRSKKPARLPIRLQSSRPLIHLLNPFKGFVWLVWRGPFSLAYCDPPRSVSSRVREVRELNGLSFSGLRFIVIGLTDCSSENRGEKITSSFCLGSFASFLLALGCLVFPFGWPFTNVQYLSTP